MDRWQNIKWAVGSLVCGIVTGAALLWGVGVAFEINEHNKRVEQERQKEFIRRIVREVLEQGKTTCYLGFCETKKWQ